MVRAHSSMFTGRHQVARTPPAFQLRRRSGPGEVGVDAHDAVVAHLRQVHRQGTADESGSHDERAGALDHGHVTPLGVPRGVCSRVVKHTLSLLVENKSGVLSRVAGLFTRRGFNIDSLAVSPTEDPARSRMTVTVDSSQFPVEQIAKQVDKLINVIKIRDLDPALAVSRELALIKVRADASNRGEVIQLVEIFRGQIIDVTTDSLTVQITGESDEIVNFESLVESFGVIELVKTGVVALGRGAATT